MNWSEQMLKAIVATIEATIAAKPAVTPTADTSDGLREWFAALRLLAPVPFAYLVPDRLTGATWLPPESLRFFCVDPNWIRALIDGALSPAESSTMDRALFIHLRAALTQGALPRSGFLLRSCLVARLEATRITIDGRRGGDLLAVMRRERLASDVLLVLFDAVPDTVVFSEVDHGPVFGLPPTLPGELSCDAKDRVLRIKQPPSPQNPLTSVTVAQLLAQPPAEVKLT